MKTFINSFVFTSDKETNFEGCGENYDHIRAVPVSPFCLLQHENVIRFPSNHFVRPPRAYLDDLFGLARKHVARKHVARRHLAGARGIWSTSRESVDNRRGARNWIISPLPPPASACLRERYFWRIHVHRLLRRSGGVKSCCSPQICVCRYRTLTSHPCKSVHNSSKKLQNLL